MVVRKTKQSRTLKAKRIITKKPTGSATTKGEPPRIEDETTQYAKDVLSGKVVAGELVHYAANRHLKDLRDGAKRGLHFDVVQASRAINFFPAVLTITAGALEGHPFILLPWHKFFVGSIFGWRKSSGRMRFRNAWAETGKGQAKSPLFGAIGLYMMGYYGIRRSEVYAIAWDRDQANILFRDAVAMCRAQIPGRDEGETLESCGEVIIRGTLDNAWKIEHPALGSKFQSLANGENVSGPRPTTVLADEIHEFKAGTQIETWKRAIAKMPGDAIMLLGTNTPSTNQITGTEYSTFYQRIAKEEVKDDEAFSFIARVDKKDNPFEDESCWVKSLPALGITFPIENIRGEVNTAKVLLSTSLSVKRLYFGIPVGSSEFWISEEAWSEVQGKFDLNKLRKAPCWLSLDLSQKNDLTALSACWLGDDGILYVKTWYWTTREGLEDRVKKDQAPYDVWVAGGYITAIDQPTIDYTYVAAQVAELVATYNVQFLCFDPAFISSFIQACNDIQLDNWLWEGEDRKNVKGLKLVKHGQGKRVAFEDKQLCMPKSIVTLEDRVLAKTIVIEDSPVTYSCAANAKVDSDGQKNRAFDKKKSTGRIDGLVTIAMAVGASDIVQSSGKSGWYPENIEEYEDQIARKTAEYVEYLKNLGN